MAWTNDQIYKAVQDSYAQGFSNEDIMKGLAKYGVDANQAIEAYQTSRPDLFAQSGDIMANVNSGNFAANTADPKFQALTQMNDYVRGLSGGIDPAQSTAISTPVASAPGQVQYVSQPGQMTPPAYGSYSSPGGIPDYGGTGFGSPNPYLPGMADDITRRTQSFLNDNMRNARTGAIMAGGYGGSAMGNLEGKAISGATDYLSGNLAKLYGGAYESDANRNLNRYGMDQNFYTAQRGQDLSQTALGANLYASGTQGEWGPLQSANGVYSPWSGFGTSSTSGQQGGGWPGLLGGAIGGAALGGQLGWWGR